MTVDTKVYELAEWFLDEHGIRANEAERLAKRIQDTIEDEVDCILEERQEAAKDAYWDHKIQQWKDGEIAVNGRFRGEK